MNSVIKAFVLLVGAGAATAGLYVVDARNRAAARAQAEEEINAAARVADPTPRPRVLETPRQSVSAAATAPSALPITQRQTPADGGHRTIVRNQDPVTPSPQGPVAVSAPMARQALQSVGTDDHATQLWATAINDQSIAADLRKDLIEDLNQDGFPDPRNLTEADLPLIDNRIALIEQLGPDAMDDTNFAAFQEAYKDLLNMRSRLVQP
jgi:hypothetical protein